MLPLLTALVLTVLLHSTLLGLAALLVAPRIDSPTRRTWILRAAIIAPLMTASVQVAAGGGLGWSDWSVPSAGNVTVGAPAKALTPAAVEHTAALDVAPGVPRATQAAPTESAPSWRGGLLLTWFAVALGGCLLLVVQRRRFLRSLGRDSFDDTDARRRLNALSDRASILLTASDAITVPLAVSSNEICLPRARWNDLTGGQRDALLAHELAHVERRDPFWFLVENIVERALFVQPLTRVLRRASRRAAEIACDERAARVTAEPMELARCLATVAGWAQARQAPASMASMAHGDAPVVDRVERLLAFDGASQAEGGQRTFALGLIAALTAFACVAPSVTTGDDGADLNFARHTPLAPGTLLVAIEEDGATTLSNDSGQAILGTFDLDDDIKSFQTALAKAASQFPRGGPGPMGDTLADGVLRIRTTADTPFYYAQRVMEACGSMDVQIWNLELETTGTRDEVHAYRLPTDIGVGAARPGRVDLAVRVAATSSTGRLLESRVGYSDGHPMEEVEEIEEEEQPEETIEEVSTHEPGDEAWAEITEEITEEIDAPPSTVDMERDAVEQRIKRYLSDRWSSDRAVAIDRVGLVLATTQAETVALDIRPGVTGREVATLIDEVIGAGAVHLMFVGEYPR